MFVSLLEAEWYKLKRNNIYALLIIGPLLTLLIGAMNPMMSQMEGFNPWYSLFLFMNLPYALLFLPLITGVLAGIVCRYEHQAGGWKQLAALPVTRSQIYVAKFVLIAILVLVIQLMYGVVVYVAGMVNGFEESFPFIVISKFIFGGWIATFPMIALQLWAAMHWRSFAVAFTLNVIFTLPGILAINSERFGPYYPWAQPFFMMYAEENMPGIFFVPISQVLLVTGGSFILFLLLGLLSFNRKAI
ncbi:ABC transporter permease [Siminovitchia sp. 179-K 8D1 HS]|uniref:ABC transporter permease n=1 Tax=Siminovitchia sp. 179-K 8D1 HS TaxID=3142385 RepID=UPI00399F8FE2